MIPRGLGRAGGRSQNLGNLLYTVASGLPRLPGEQCLSTHRAAGHASPSLGAVPHAPDGQALAAHSKQPGPAPASLVLGSVPCKPICTNRRGPGLRLRNEEIKGTIGAFSTKGESIL